MEPVQRPLGSHNGRLLIIFLLGVVCLFSTAIWLQRSLQPQPAPMTANEIDNRLMESGKEEFVQLPASSPANRKLFEAQEALAARQPDRAIQITNEILAVDGKNVAAYMVRVRSYFGIGNLAKAAEALAEAIRLQPELPEAYLYRGHLHKANKRYEQAIADYDRALSINPELAAAYYHRGDVSLITRQFAVALADFTVAIAKQSSIRNPMPTPYFKRGYLLYLQQDYKSAVRDLSRAIELAPSMYEAYLYRANALAALRRHDPAIRDYDHVLELKPDLALAFYGRALVWREMGETEKAEADFRKAEKLGIKRL